MSATADDLHDLPELREELTEVASLAIRAYQDRRIPGERKAALASELRDARMYGSAEDAERLWRSLVRARNLLADVS